MSRRLTIAPVKREGGTDLLAIVKGGLQFVEALAGVAQVDDDPAVVAAFLTAVAVSL